MAISLIAALDENFAIGRKGQLPWHLPDDLRWFKELTLGKYVLMGYNTAVAIGRPLPDRTNLVLSRKHEALDPELVGEVLNVIRSLAFDGMTMILVTHEIAFAREVADQVIFMRDGVVVEAGPPSQVIDNPQQAATQSFLTRFNG